MLTPEHSLYPVLEKYQGFLAGFANVTATITADVEMRVWNGKHPVEDNITKRTAVAGTRVLIWMFSRFGDVGITDNLIPPHCAGGPRGYDARVPTDIITDVIDLGMEWNGKILEKEDLE